MKFVYGGQPWADQHKEVARNTSLTFNDGRFFTWLISIFTSEAHDSGFKSRQSYRLACSEQNAHFTLSIGWEIMMHSLSNILFCTYIYLY